MNVIRCNKLGRCQWRWVSPCQSVPQVKNTLWYFLFCCSSVFKAAIFALLTLSDFWYSLYPCSTPESKDLEAFAGGLSQLGLHCVTQLHKIKISQVESGPECKRDMVLYWRPLYTHENYLLSFQRTNISFMLSLLMEAARAGWCFIVLLFRLFPGSSFYSDWSLAHRKWDGIYKWLVAQK